jgi:tRNA(Ile2)-agmatinylcytidine synthase
MGWLGLDDTDSLMEGCTTYSFHLLLESLPTSVTVVSPRLVRLWPFAQHRTRGNAAVAVELLVEDEVEFIQYLEVFWNDHLLPTKGKISPSQHDDREQYPADPGMVWFSSQQPAEEFYTLAVQSEVDLTQVPTADRSWGGQGRIGATAAIAWRQKRCTWEAIAWREINRHGQLERAVCEQALTLVDSMPSTFLSRDPRKGTGLVAPRGPCPVLFGVRARDSTSALEAGSKLLAAESTESTVGMRVFVTNQATDDHLSHSQKATVAHVEILSRGNCVITTESGKWLAFAESGSVKKLAQWLQPGDVIEGYGLSPEFGVLHLEKLRVVSAHPTQHRPMCGECSVRMKSMGKGQGCRCPKCKQRTDDAWDSVARIPPAESWVQPPVDARRHLARPLEWEDSTDSSSFMGNQ